MINIGIKYLPNYNLEKLGEIKIDNFCRFNLYASIKNEIDLLPFVGFPYQANDYKPKLIPTGISIKIPNDYQLIINSSPNLVYKGITILNSPIVIVNDYSLEIRVMLINFNSKYFKLKQNECIAQCHIQKITNIRFYNGF